MFYPLQLGRIAPSTENLIRIHEEINKRIRLHVVKGTLSLRFLFPYIKDLDPLNTVNTVKQLFLPPNHKKNGKKNEKFVLSVFEK